METFQVTIVSAMTGEIIAVVDAEPDWTLLAVKAAAQIPHRLLLEEHVLLDGRTLREQGICRSEILHAVRSGGAVGCFERRWSRLGKASIELRGDGTASVRGHYRGGPSSPVSTWHLHLECWQNLPSLDTDADSVDLELVVAEICSRQGVAATPELGKAMRNNANVEVGMTFAAQLCGPKGNRMLYIEDLPWGRGESDLPEVTTPDDSSAFACL